MVGAGMSTGIVWFRRDLRLEDNPALTAALAAHDTVACLFVHAPDEEAPWSPGAASRWWLHHSLVRLSAELERRGGALHVCRGDSAGTLRRIARECGANALYWNRLYEPALVRRDADIKSGLRADGFQARSFNANLLVEPWTVQTGSGGPYRVFTPFWRNVRAGLQAQAPDPAPRRIQGPRLSGGEAIDALELLPRIPWDRGMREAWEPGEQGAQAAFAKFREDAIADYKDGRDRPDQALTSRLSPYLHFGEIGPRQIFWALERPGSRARGAREQAASEAFVRELGWREFSHHLLFHYPQTPERNLNGQFDAFPWAPRDAGAIRRWQRGLTGIPIVDAGMRELWTTGWMHNRVRMLVASLLTKNLRQHWLEGARWFWDTLVDADLANNTQGWQWTAGCGADAAPYVRIFNPVTQGLRFDPQGDYVRRWVPELRDLPAPLIHQPWKDPAALARAGYPEPLVDLAASRQEALQAYNMQRSSSV
jgi:deoxyribodipyrimidine photo-lyase